MADALAEEWHAHLTMPRTDDKLDDREEFILALLADRARDQERIVALEKALRPLASPVRYRPLDNPAGGPLWIVGKGEADEARALLEVLDAK